MIASACNWTLQYAIIFLVTFGPKIGYFDFSVLGSAIGMLFLLRTRRPIVIPGGYVVMTSLLLALVLQALFMGSADIPADATYFLLRSSRTLINTCFIGLWVVNSNIPASRYLTVVLLCLGTNALAVLCQYLGVIPIESLAALYGFDKQFGTGRAFGLSAGYDTAGYLCVFGMVCVYMLYVHRQQSVGWNIGVGNAVMAFFFLASLCTSRSTMMLSSAVLLAIIWANISTTKSAVSRALSMTTAALALVMFLNFILPVMLNSITEFGSVSSLTQGESRDYSSSFAKTSLSVFYNRMVFATDDPFRLAFGYTLDTPNSDIGYIKTLYMAGIFGLAITMSFYLYIAVRMFQAGRGMRMAGDREALNVRLLIIALVVIIFVANMKNLYFFTRTYHEITLILFFVVAKMRRERSPRRTALADAPGIPPLPTDQFKAYPSHTGAPVA